LCELSCTISAARQDHTAAEIQLGLGRPLFEFFRVYRPDRLRLALARRDKERQRLVHNELAARRMVERDLALDQEDGGAAILATAPHVRAADAKRGAGDVYLDVAPQHASERAGGITERTLHDIQQTGQRTLGGIILAQRHQRETRLFAQFHKAAVGKLDDQPTALAGFDDIRLRQCHAGARRQTFAGMFHPRRHLQAVDLCSATGGRGKKKRGGNSEKQNRAAHEKLPFFCYSQLCTAKKRVVQARRRQKLCNC
jgi:hypothetical protein